ncbi:hypothetical protein EDD37DRAFT_66078 [Exophiala viscosa]|uniref:Nicotinamide-nucleotide adenylyltransferase n=1 Tax=Exophiala viscosa TaxID=2486360 RepID=A0AAN6E405_9EURO|nr:hypothetical protein EDD36DRAFT_143989 [Exophiala viscosa]KAI1629716.1 hypothetical protein EDD37DRAFT_66078 [Exophiala viscosa]
MSPSDIDMQALQTLRSQFSQALKDFASSSSSNFKVLRSVPSSLPPSSSPIRTLYVLDSSFNPPSKAHLSLAKSALKSSDSTTDTRALFLLATVNADKKPKPADFEDRLIMMTLMAEELRAAFSAPGPADGAPAVDIGITKQPYFIDKAVSIDESSVYTSSSPNPETHFSQIHLTGFDTLIRIFTAKYYPDHDPPLSALEPFLTRHGVRATVRVDKNTTSENLKDTTTESGSDLSSVEGQKAYLKGIADGDKEAEGAKREWAERVELVVDDSGETEGVSSTKIRNAVKEGNWDEVNALVGKGVGEWIRERGLYEE